MHLDDGPLERAIAHLTAGDDLDDGRAAGAGACGELGADVVLVHRDGPPQRQALVAGGRGEQRRQLGCLRLDPRDVERGQGVVGRALAGQAFLAGGDGEVVDAQLPRDLAAVDERGGCPEQARRVEGAVGRGRLEVRRRLPRLAERLERLEERALDLPVEPRVVVVGAEAGVAADDEAPTWAAVAEQERDVEADPAVADEVEERAVTVQRAPLGLELLGAALDDGAHLAEHPVQLGPHGGRVGLAREGAQQVVPPVPLLLPLVELLEDAPELGRVVLEVDLAAA